MNKQNSHSNDQMYMTPKDKSNPFVLGVDKQLSTVKPSKI